ncbi:MAG TPA: DUF5693 family protein [Actinopolymorphaceae bacterium]
MRRSWLAFVLLLFVAIGLSVPALTDRVAAERSMPHASVAVADSALVAWLSDGADPGDLVRRLRAAGVETVVLGTRPISEVAVVSDGYAVPKPGVPRGDVLEALRARYGTAVRDAGQNGFWVEGLERPADIADAAFDYDTDRMRFLRENGFRVVLALPPDVTSSGRQWLDGELGRATKETSASLAMAHGAMPDFAPSTRPDYLRRFGLDLVVPDLARVPGAADYARPGRLIRAHNVAIGPSSSVDVMTSRIQRAEKERGVRLIVLRGPDEKLDVDAPLDRTLAIARVANSEPPPGIDAGPPSAMPDVRLEGGARVASVLAALIVIACAGRVVIGARPLLVALGVAAAAAVGFWTVRGSGTQILMLATAVAGATTAVLVALRGRNAVLSYAVGGLTAVTTGVVIGGLGSSSPFLLGLEQFRGVKVLLLVPTVVVGLFGLSTAYGRVDLFRLVTTLSPVHVVVGLIVVAVAAFYLIRSGNSGLALDPELWMRDWLDAHLYARPRFKEAFIGLPALLLAAAWKGLFRWILAVVASVGTASIVDTFAHFHTPLGISLLRTAYALVIGMVLGGLIWLVVRRRVQ